LPLDVGARAEARAFAREQHRPSVADVGEGLRQLGDERRVEGVPPLGPGEHDAANGTVSLDAEGGHRVQEHKVGVVIQGALAAAATPLREDGAALDEDAFGPLAEFLAAGGLDGILAMGTTGEGISLRADERKRATDLFLDACRGRLAVAVHCGAQTTADTVALAAHAGESGADAVAVIAPPYFPLDEAALLAHFEAAAQACAPTPFYVYEFAKASGYAVPVAVVERLRERAPNLAGMKVSDVPWERFEPYLIEGLDVFVGPERLIRAGMERGARGAVSGLATAFPELVADAVRAPAGNGGERAGDLREAIERFPRHAALKRALARRGVPIREDVRPPLRVLTAEERSRLDELVGEWVG
jgi:N-acetylneuraminate lyase